MPVSVPNFMLFLLSIQWVEFMRRRLPMQLDHDAATLKMKL